VYIPDIPGEIKTYNTENWTFAYTNNNNNNNNNDENTDKRVCENKSSDDGFKPLCNYYDTSVAYNEKIECSNGGSTGSIVRQTVLCSNCKIMVDCENGNTADLNNTTDDDGDDTANITEIMNKVKMTKMALYKNTLNDKKSALVHL
jgi:hypothetical protein